MDFYNTRFYPVRVPGGWILLSDTVVCTAFHFGSKGVTGKDGSIMTVLCVVMWWLPVALPVEINMGLVSVLIPSCCQGLGF